jgi:pyruvate dehydrogenase E2 component (dihydrolipoamide acetyltransferase)
VHVAERAPRAPGERIKASPVARRIARERGVALETLTGTGPGGRIVKSDVEAAAGAAPAQAPAPAPPPAAAAAPAAPPPAPAPSGPSEPGTAKGAVTITELTRTQALIARRMAESRATVPAFTLRATFDLTQAVELRATLKASGAEAVPSYNDLIVKACAIALAEHPKANGAYRDARFERYERVNVGIAVAAEGALVVPTIFDADRKGLAQIAAESRALAERVRAGVITPPELSGGTFTVSNLGMYGVRSFEAVINPPQAAILSVGALEQRPVVRDGEVVVRHVLDVELACDHRILYGAEAAEFLARIRGILEAPLSLAL